MDGEKMDQQSALKLLVNAVHIGQTRGVWKLDEAVLLNKAIAAFVTKDSKEKSEGTSALETVAEADA